MNDIYILEVFCFFKITRQEFITGKLISHERVKYLKIFKISGENRKKKRKQSKKTKNLNFYYLDLKKTKSESRETLNDAFFDAKSSCYLIAESLTNDSETNCS